MKNVYIDLPIPHMPQFYDDPIPNVEQYKFDDSDVDGNVTTLWAVSDARSADNRAVNESS